VEGGGEILGAGEGAAAEPVFDKRQLRLGELDGLSQTPKGWVSALPGGAMTMSRTAPQ
jgi:hypothetical protein